MRSLPLTVLPPALSQPLSAVRPTAGRALVWASTVLAVAASTGHAAAQGPDTGSPFTDASLPFESLKAPPESAFQILMVSIGVFLLVAIVIGMFLLLSKVGSIEELLRRSSTEAAGARAREHLALMEALERIGQGTTDGDEEAVPDPAELAAAAISERLGAPLARVEAALQDVRGAVERAADTPGGPFGAESNAPGGLSRGDLDELLSELAGSRAEQAGLAREVAERLGALPGALADRLAIETGAPAAPVGNQRAEVLDRVHGRLLALGYESVDVVTSGDELRRALEVGGELVVEARRSGGIYKGKVALEGGNVVDVALRPNHQIFP